MAVPHTTGYPLHRHLLRVAGLGAALAVTGALGMYLCWKVPHPFLLQHQQRGELRVLRSQLAAERALHRRLEREKQVLSSPEGIALEARRLNYVRPGERPLRFLTPPPPRPPAPTGPPPRPTLGARLYQASHQALSRAGKALHRFTYGR